MLRISMIAASLGLLVSLAIAAGLTLGALLATLGIGLLTSLFLAPAVFVSELIARRCGAERSGGNGPCL